MDGGKRNNKRPCALDGALYEEINTLAETEQVVLQGKTSQFHSCKAAYTAHGRILKSNVDAVPAVCLSPGVPVSHKPALNPQFEGLVNADCLQVNERASLADLHRRSAMIRKKMNDQISGLGKYPPAKKKIRIDHSREKDPALQLNDKQAKLSLQGRPPQLESATAKRGVNKKRLHSATPFDRLQASLLCAAALVFFLVSISAGFLAGIALNRASASSSSGENVNQSRPGCSTSQPDQTGSWCSGALDNNIINSKNY